jgi:dihydropteroate synthase
MFDPSQNTHLDARGKLLPLGKRTLMMGVINVTPDSFFDGGRYPTPQVAVAASLQLIAEGADIIDVGGESTRPGHTPVSAEEELARALPVITALTHETAAPISIDTYKAAVVEKAFKAGAHIVNDVWGLSRDPNMAAVVAAHDAAVIIMHNREKADSSLDIIDELKAFFEKAIDRAVRAGIRKNRIVLDPGIGFGKTLDQNLAAIAHLEELVQLGFPVLLGVSRKSFIGKLFKSEAEERLPGTIAANVAGVLAGVSIIRVHDVAAHAQALKIAEAIRGASR